MNDEAGQQGGAAETSSRDFIIHHSYFIIPPSTGNLTPVGYIWSYERAHSGGCAE